MNDGDEEKAKQQWSALLEQDPPPEIRQLLTRQLTALGVEVPDVTGMTEEEAVETEVSWERPAPADSVTTAAATSAACVQALWQHIRSSEWVKRSGSQKKRWLLRMNVY